MTLLAPEQTLSQSPHFVFKSKPIPLFCSEYSLSLTCTPRALLKYLSYSHNACSIFFRDNALLRNAGNCKPKVWKPELEPEGAQRSLSSLVYFSSPLVVLSGKILRRPFFAPGPRHAHWLSVQDPMILHSRRSQRICQAKKAPIFGI